MFSRYTYLRKREDVNDVITRYADVLAIVIDEVLISVVPTEVIYTSISQFWTAFCWYLSLEDRGSLVWARQTYIESFMQKERKYLPVMHDYATTVLVRYALELHLAKVYNLQQTLNSLSHKEGTMQSQLECLLWMSGGQRISQQATYIINQVPACLHSFDALSSSSFVKRIPAYSCIETLKLALFSTTGSWAVCMSLTWERGRELEIATLYVTVQGSCHQSKILYVLLSYLLGCRDLWEPTQRFPSGFARFHSDRFSKRTCSNCAWDLCMTTMLPALLHWDHAFLSIA